MTFLRDLVSLRSSIENPATPITAASAAELFGASPTAAGVAVTEKSALSIIAFFRGVQIIAQAVAGAPLHAYMRADNSRTDLPTCLRFEEPSPYTSFEFWETFAAHQVTWGKGLAFKHRNRAGEVVAFTGIHPSRVKIDVVKGERARLLGVPHFLTFTIDGTDVFTSHDILHIPGLSLDGVTGVSPIQAVRESLGTTLSAERAAASFLGKGLMLSGALETDAALEQEQADALKRRWNALYGGASRAGDVAILDRGAKFRSLTMPLADAQFLETRKHQTTEVARLLGLPGWMLNDQEKSTSWGTGMEQQFTAWVILGLRPYLQRFEQRLTRELMPKGQKAEFSVEGLLRGDAKTRAAFYASGIVNGWLVPNEARVKENLPPVEWGDVPYRPHTTSGTDPLADPTPDTGAPA